MTHMVPYMYVHVCTCMYMYVHVCTVHVCTWLSWTRTYMDNIGQVGMGISMKWAYLIIIAVMLFVMVEIGCT